ncbi:hypothetical protein AOLI_G00307790 [Acnodon oligacanthus]
MEMYEEVEVFTRQGEERRGEDTGSSLSGARDRPTALPSLLCDVWLVGGDGNRAFLHSRPLAESSGRVSCGLLVRVVRRMTKSA